MPTYALIKVFEWVWKMRTTLIVMMGFLLWVTKIIQTLVVAGFHSIFQMINDIDFNTIEQLEPPEVANLELIGFVNALFPLAECMALLSIYYTLWLSIITLRWVKSFIPTIAN